MSLGDTLFAAGLFAVIGGIVWSAMQPRYEFVLRIRGGKLTPARGRVTAAFLHTAIGIVEENGVEQGWIAGERHGKRVRLAVSRSFPAGAAQQLRNAWHF